MDLTAAENVVLGRGIIHAISIREEQIINTKEQLVSIKAS